jgi:hypothetical protein
MHSVCASGAGAGVFFSTMITGGFSIDRDEMIPLLEVEDTVSIHLMMLQQRCYRGAPAISQINE